MFFEDSSDHNGNPYQQNMAMSEELLHYHPIEADSIIHISHPNELEES